MIMVADAPINIFYSIETIFLDRIDYPNDSIRILFHIKMTKSYLFQAQNTIQLFDKQGKRTVEECNF